jgi:hypothetical protein
MTASDGVLALGCHSCHTTRGNAVRRPLWALANRAREEMVRVEQVVRGAIRHVHGPQDVPCGEDEAVVLCLARNASLWIRSFVEHHLALGVRHIFYLDNASDDQSVSIASRYDRVSVFTTRLSFRRYEVGLRRWLVRTFGRGRWSLNCDVDELFDYPSSNRLPLAGLLRYLRHYGYQAVTGQMLDLFSDRPFSRLHSSPDDDLRTTYRFYDLADLVPTREVYWIRNGQVGAPEIACLFGGIRKRFFGDDCLLLTKHPLVYGAAGVGVYTYDGHFMTGARIADISTVLLHYKYVANVAQRAQRSVRERWHKESSTIYGGLAEVLEHDPDLCLRRDTAAELRDVDELVERGLLVVSPQYREWVTRYGR